jgi:hypothetical protein
MQDLESKYIDTLEEIAGAIQESDELARYLEEEEEDDYLALKEAYEPQIAELYHQVAREHPLQLIALEKALLLDEFEGLYLPKVLGYTVLRGELNDKVKYARPQNHFREVLIAICNSANFDILKKRIGQSVQIGFALSSDIWITNLINSFDNKRIRYYLQAQKLDRYRVAKERKIGVWKYKRQFANENYQTAEFPATLGELTVLYSPLRIFMVHRIKLKDGDNATILPELMELIENKDFQGTKEHLNILALFAHFFHPGDANLKKVAKVLNQVRGTMDEFELHWWNALLEMETDGLDVTPEADLQVAGLLDFKQKDELTKYYQLMELLHERGYRDEEAQKAIQEFHLQFEGLSEINECLRRTVFRYFHRFLSNLEVTDYPEYFEINKTFSVYIQIFGNQQFNQDVKELSLAFIKRCLKHFTDKRGKDYQDIKKFVSATFLDLGFMKEKEITELFKTRRKKKKQTA